MLFLLLACNSGGQKPGEDIVMDTALPYPEDTGTAPDTDTGECVPEECNGVLDPNGPIGSSQTCISFSEVSSDVGIATSGSHSGFSLADLNGDGKFTDITLFNYGVVNQLFRNTGGSFSEDTTNAAGLNVGGGDRQAVWADYDEDGDKDLLLTGFNGTRLSQNNGGVYSELISPSGIQDSESTAAAIWINGGFLLATNSGTRFYESLGGNTFTASVDAKDRAEEIGLDDAGTGTAFAVADVNGDGFDDIYLANSTGKNRFWLNNGDGTFEAVDEDSGAVELGNDGSTDADWIDFNDDGFLDLFVSDYDGDNQLHLGNGDGTFGENVAADYGVQSTGKTMSTAWGDYLGNGNLAAYIGHWEDDATDDINQENLLLHPSLNESGEVSNYENIAPGVGVDDNSTTIKAEWFDFDNDEDLDLFVVMYDGGVRLYQNDNHEVTVCEE